MLDCGIIYSVKHTDDLSVHKTHWLFSWLNGLTLEFVNKLKKSITKTPPDHN